MASRSTLEPIKLFAAQDMTSTLHSAPFLVNQPTLVSISLGWTGTPTGTFQLEVSNDVTFYANGTVNNPGTWTSLPLSHTPTASGSTGSDFINAQGVAAYAARLSYTAASGSGSLTAIAMAKVA